MCMYAVLAFGCVRRHPAVSIQEIRHAMQEGMQSCRQAHRRPGKQGAWLPGRHANIHTGRPGSSNQGRQESIPTGSQADSHTGRINKAEHTGRPAGGQTRRQADIHKNIQAGRHTKTHTARGTYQHTNSQTTGQIRAARHTGTGRDRQGQGGAGRQRHAQAGKGTGTYRNLEQGIHTTHIHRHRHT